MKKKICFLLTIFLFCFCLLPSSVYASQDVYCPLCVHRDDDDPLYNKERQFYQKISIIKTVFGDSIDEVALAAAVLHRYNNAELAFEREYDNDFNEDDYKNSWLNVSNSKSETVTSDGGNVLFSEEDAKRVQANEQIDLITTTAIVMIDSNHFGKYSDVCFKDGLAGDGLVGNTGDNGSFVKLFNALFCGAYQTVEGSLTPLDFIASFFSGDNIFVSAESSKRRLVNIKKVCENGYVGGLYNGVYKVENEDQKKNLKQEYAKQIIDFANYYKKLYGKYEEEESSSCVSSGSESGEFAKWKQYDDRWKNVSMGDSNLGRIGCLVTSIAIQIARSGTKIGTLPSGYSEFNPGAFTKSLSENGGFVIGGNFAWTGQKTIAPNVEFGDFVSVNITDNKKLAEVLSKELASNDDRGTKYIVIQIKHAKSSQHWIAIDSVTSDNVTLFDPGSDGTNLDDNYKSWVVQGYKTIYVKDAGNSSNNNSCVSGAGGNDLNRYIGYIAYTEGHTMCNFQGKGEETGYAVETLPNDPGGATTAFGLTSSDLDDANKIGYTSYLDELYSGCTEKEKTEKLLLASIETTRELTQAQLDQAGVTASENEKFALSSVNYGGVALAVPIIQAMKTYGKDSVEVFEAFKNSFGNMSYADGLMRRRFMEYEMFMTGNYETEPANYLGWSGIYSKASSMSLDEVKSKWPTKRDELLEGMPFAPINGTGTINTSSGTGNGELVCRNGNAVRVGGSGSSFIEGTCLDKTKKNRVLFFGNSKTVGPNGGEVIRDNNVAVKFEGIAKSMGYDVEVETVDEGAPYQFSRINNHWDCFVDQQCTNCQVSAEGIKNALSGRIGTLKGANPDVKIYSRQIWAFCSGGQIRDDDFLKKCFEGNEKGTSDAGAILIPDGKAFLANKNENPNINICDDDRHQNSTGAYLVGATVFKALSGESPIGSTYYAEIGKDRASAMQQIADEVVQVSSTSASDLTGVVDCAKKQLGKDYVWATHGPDTFDCSGLTYYCYNKALNVDITASSDAQWDDTEHFTDVDSIDKLVPGDLIVSRGGGHVSIYIGNGEVIHASSPSVGVIQSPASQHKGPIKYKHYKGK